MKFSIGELEKLTGMNRTALRYYDAEGLIDPERQENGYRLYSDEDVMSLIQLKQMSAFGIELSEMPGSARNVGIKDVCLSTLSVIGRSGQIRCPSWSTPFSRLPPPSAIGAARHPATNTPVPNFMTVRAFSEAQKSSLPSVASRTASANMRKCPHP